MATTVVEIVLGAVLAVVTTAIIENARKPKLSLSIARPEDQTYGAGAPASRARFLLVNCTNAPQSWFMRWMARSAALQCHGTVTFHHLDGQGVFGRVMPTRWSKSPQPVTPQIVLGEQKGVLIDPDRLQMQSRMDIYPGETCDLGVAARFDDDAECYGWSNLNYGSSPPWRHPDWKLLRGRYLAKVVVISAGERCERLFRISNEGPVSDFRLEEALSNDRVR